MRAFFPAVGPSDRFGRARMRRQKPVNWWLLPALLVAAVLLFFSLRGVNWHDLYATIRRARLLLLALSLGLVNTSFFLRALRWRILLTPKAPVTRRVVFSAMALGYLGNSLLPARAGDVIRSAIMKRRSSISFSYALASTFTERIVDVAALVITGLITVASFRGLDPWIIHTTRIMAAVGCIGILALFLLPRMEDSLARLVLRTPLVRAAHTGLGTVAREFLLGMRSLQEPIRACRFAGITIGIWIIDALSTMAVASSVNLSLTLAQALLLLAALGLSSVVPSTPGYIGIYQFVAVTVLMPLGFTRSHAIAFIFLYQGVVYCVILFWGAIFSWHDLAPWRESAREQPEPIDRLSAVDMLPMQG
jgi:glycosyltransferase 2 family protein